jgi:hypothetical protein
MKMKKQSLLSRKQLAFELGECCGKIARGASIPVARAAKANAEEAPNNIIYIGSEIVLQEQAERGMHYANIVALAKHLE